MSVPLFYVLGYVTIYNSFYIYFIYFIQKNLIFHLKRCKIQLETKENIF